MRLASWIWIGWTACAVPTSATVDDRADRDHRASGLASEDDAPAGDGDEDRPVAPDSAPPADTTADTGSSPVVSDDVTVEVLEAAHLFFGSTNQRSLDVTVRLPPATERYRAITLDARLSCPNNRCDPWDRWGTIGVVVDPAADPVEVVELSRFVTPYGVGTAWTEDVTDLRPLLTGDVTLRAFIDTWVGPGSAYGDGWQLDASLRFEGGDPPREVLGVVPIWNVRAAVYGDPARPPSTELPRQTRTLPVGTVSVGVRAFITGHGQGNLENCAEFCPRRHALDIDGASFSKRIWRADCRQTAPSNQKGSWTYSRAGWCPGTGAAPWTLEVDAPGDGELDVAWDVESYVNTCRPDAPTCAGCALGTGCGYDGGSHTEPHYQISAAAIAYGDRP